MNTPKHLAPHIRSIWDNGGETIDRYIVVYDYPYYDSRNCTIYQAYALNKYPFHPQGFAQHVGASEGEHLGTEITWDDLPKDCQRAIAMDFDEN